MEVCGELLDGGREVAEVKAVGGEGEVGREREEGGIRVEGAERERHGEDGDWEEEV